MHLFVIIDWNFQFFIYFSINLESEKEYSHYFQKLKSYLSIIRISIYLRVNLYTACCCFLLLLTIMSSSSSSSYLTSLCLLMIVERSQNMNFPCCSYYNYDEHCSFDFHFEMKEEFPFTFRVLTIFQVCSDMIAITANARAYKSYYVLNQIQELRLGLFFLIFYLEPIFKSDLKLGVDGNCKQLLFWLNLFKFALYQMSLINDCLSLERIILDLSSFYQMFQRFKRFIRLSFDYLTLSYGLKQLMKETTEGVVAFFLEEIQDRELKVLAQLYLESCFDLESATELN